MSARNHCVILARYTSIVKEINPKYTLDVSQHDNVWFVIDTDLWGSKITDLRNFCNSQNAGLDNETWFVSQSNPCFEIWLYYQSLVKSL